MVATSATLGTRRLQVDVPHNTIIIGVERRFVKMTRAPG
jgi:hypothetical protein